MKIEVTAEDIQRGRKGNACSCPIHRAGRRAGLIDFEVWNKAVSVYLDGKKKNYPLPEVAQQFIKKFDCGQPVEPIAFELAFKEPVDA